MTLHPALMTSDRPDWCTPLEVLDLVRRVGNIALDPCADDSSIVNAERSYYLERGEDGLGLDWQSLTYCNPPYGTGLLRWTSKARREWEARNVESVLLVPARVDTRWFQECWSASAVCFWRGRLTFLGAPSAAPFPSCLVYFGHHWRRFAEVFGDRGHVVRP